MSINVVQFKSKPVKNLQQKGLEELQEMLSDRVKDGTLDKVFMIIHTKEDDYDILVVGDFQLNEVLGDLELIKDFLITPE